jgi:hypothetical protein
VNDRAISDSREDGHRYRCRGPGNPRSILNARDKIGVPLRRSAILPEVGDDLRGPRGRGLTRGGCDWQKGPARQCNRDTPARATGPTDPWARGVGADPCSWTARGEDRGGPNWRQTAQLGLYSFFLYSLFSFLS